MTDNTFPRESRLLHSGEYDKVFKHSIRASAPGMLILASRRESQQGPRLGLVVPKRILKRAVWRNRVKRIVREAFRTSKDLLKDTDVIFIARSNIGNIGNRELSAAVQRLWEQISRRLKEQRS